MRQGRWQGWGWIVGISIVLGGAPSARAEQREQREICPLCKQAANDSAGYSSKAGYTLVRGTANALFGWTELIRQPATEVKSGGNVLTGLSKGVGETVKRTFGGLGEMLTFWTPKVHDHYLHYSEDCPLCMGRKAAVASETVR